MKTKAKLSEKNISVSRRDLGRMALLATAPSLLGLAEVLAQEKKAGAKGEKSQAPKGKVHPLTTEPLHFQVMAAWIVLTAGKPNDYLDSLLKNDGTLLDKKNAAAFLKYVNDKELNEVCRKQGWLAAARQAWEKIDVNILTYSGPGGCPIMAEINGVRNAKAQDKP